jgi:hypothetical protein
MYISNIPQLDLDRPVIGESSLVFDTCILLLRILRNGPLALPVTQIDDYHLLGESACALSWSPSEQLRQQSRETETKEAETGNNSRSRKPPVRL